jgi:hypothetical protein
VSCTCSGSYRCGRACLRVMQCTLRHFRHARASAVLSLVFVCCCSHCLHGARFHAPIT